MAISTNSIIHYTSSYSVLTSILKEGLRIKYCRSGSHRKCGSAFSNEHNLVFWLIHVQSAAHGPYRYASCNEINVKNMA